MLKPTPLSPFEKRDEDAIRALRLLSLDQIDAAGSGHPGLPLGAAPMAYVLFMRHFVGSTRDPFFLNRDRFVLSAGHGSALLYALLHLFGARLSKQDLQQFRRLDSKTPGHPERCVASGIEVTTGPLGQGFAQAVGLAVAERHLGARFMTPDGPLVDHRTWVLASDGDLMEGVVHEAAALAGHWGLGKLIVLYDANEVTLDGPLSIASSEDITARFRAAAWQVLHVAQGDDDLHAIDQALVAATADVRRPSLIIIKTTIGFGAPTVAGTHRAHGSPLSKTEAALTRAALGAPEHKPFSVADAVYEHVRQAQGRGEDAVEAFRVRQRNLSPELRRALAQQSDTARAPDLLAAPFSAGNIEAQSTREASRACLAVLTAQFPALLGGDADLSQSTCTTVAESVNFGRHTPSGRNFRFGVREHAMAAIACGITAHSHLRIFVATYLAFSDYLRPSLRIAAMSRLPVIFVLTHDSVAVGEDGPTHQPVEQLQSLRCMPNLRVLRPADAVETALSWELALARRSGPTALILSRQRVPVLPPLAYDASTRRTHFERGLYRLGKAEDGSAQKATVLLFASGSEVQLICLAAPILRDQGISVELYSVPSLEAFYKLSEAARAGAMTEAVRARVCVEAAASWGWHRLAGPQGRVLGIDRFGLSATGPEALRVCKITVEDVVQAAQQSVEAVRGAE